LVAGWSVANSSTDLLMNLFDSVPHVMLCVKDRAGRYTAANAAFVQRTNRRHTRDVIGRRAAELFPAGLAASYDAQDQAILSTGKPRRNQLEIITDAAGHPQWFLTTKVLAAEHDQPFIVVASVPAHLSRSGAAADGLRAAVELIHRDVTQPLDVETLANHAGMSTDQLERAFSHALGTSPKQYVLRARVEEAATQLATTNLPVAEVAARCGYYDQSHLTRQFAAITGLTPRRYRASARGVAEGPIARPSAGAIANPKPRSGGRNS
jgi:AraC-like DNA-binding protein